MYYFKLVLLKKTGRPVGRISASTLLEKIKKNKKIKEICDPEKALQGVSLFPFLYFYPFSTSELTDFSKSFTFWPQFLHQDILMIQR